MTLFKVKLYKKSNRMEWANVSLKGGTEPWYCSFDIESENKRGWWNIILQNFHNRMVANYLIPRLKDIEEKLLGFRVFSNMDIYQP